MKVSSFQYCIFSLPIMRFVTPSRSASRTTALRSRAGRSLRQRMHANLCKSGSPPPATNRECIKKPVAKIVFLFGTFRCRKVPKTIGKAKSRGAVRSPSRNGRLCAGLQVNLPRFSTLAFAPSSFRTFHVAEFLYPLRGCVYKLRVLSFSPPPNVGKGVSEPARLKAAGNGNGARAPPAVNRPLRALVRRFQPFPTFGSLLHTFWRSKRYKK